MFIVCAGKLRENHLPSCVSTFKQAAQTDRETRRPRDRRDADVALQTAGVPVAVAVKGCCCQTGGQTDRTIRKCGLNISKSFIYQHH